MPWEDITSGDIVTEDYLDSISEQVVVRCTSSTRPSSPPEGMVIIETNTGLMRRFDGTDWLSFPAGILAEDEGDGTGVGGFIAGTQVLVNGSLLTFDCVSGERYQYQASFTVAGIADDAFTIVIKRDGSVVDITRYVWITNALAPVTVSFHTSFGDSTGSHTMGVYIQGDSGTAGSVPVGGDFTLTHLGTAP